MAKKFSIHDWQAKIRLAEQQDDDPNWQKRQDALTPGKNPDAFYGPGSPYQKLKQKSGNKSQESMSNADIKALQTVVGEYSLNKVLNTIAVIAGRIGKDDEADMIKKLANKIQDFDEEELDETSMTGTGASFNAGAGEGYMSPKAFGNNKSKKRKAYMGYKEINEQEQEEEELEKDAKKVADHPLVDKINTRDEWIDLMQAIIDHGEENISQVNPSVMKTFLMNALRDLNKPKS